MTFAVRLLVLAVALLALALTTATSFAGRNARARAEAGAEAQRAAPPSPRDQRPASRLADARPATATGSGGRARLLARAEAASTSGVARRPSATTDRPRAATAPRATLLRVRAGRTVAVRGRPGGDVIGRLSARTEFGSPQVVSAVKRRGRWLGVASTVRTELRSRSSNW